MILLLLACATEGPGAAGDSGVCADAPYVGWETFGAGFVLENCQACHSATSQNRRDAPEDVNFDTVEQVWERADLILAYAGAEPPTMPPLGGTMPEDRELLRIWLTCGEPGT